MCSRREAVPAPLLAPVVLLLLLCWHSWQFQPPSTTI